MGQAGHDPVELTKGVGVRTGSPSPAKSPIVTGGSWKQALRARRHRDADGQEGRERRRGSTSGGGWMLGRGRSRFSAEDVVNEIKAAGGKAIASTL